MTKILISVFIIIFILIWILIKSLKKYEDSNYSTLRKLFFAVNSENINSKYISDNNNVYGVLMETNLKGGKKIVFASFITGFAGYYQNKGGGIIGGKYYTENHRGVVEELMELCDKKLLIGESQTKKTRYLAAKLTLKANGFLNDMSPSGTNISGDPKSTNFWFLTKGGVYYAHVKKIKSNNCKWTVLINEVYTIIHKLKKE